MIYDALIRSRLPLKIVDEVLPTCYKKLWINSSIAKNNSNQVFDKIIEKILICGNNIVLSIYIVT